MIKSFPVSDTVRVDADTLAMLLVIRDADDVVVVLLDEVKSLITQLVEATIYLCNQESTSSR